MPLFWPDEPKALVRVFVRGRDVLGLASVGFVLVFGMLVRMRVKRPILMPMLVLVPYVHVRVCVHDTIRMPVFVGVF